MGGTFGGNRHRGMPRNKNEFWEPTNRFTNWLNVQLNGGESALQISHFTHFPTHSPKSRKKGEKRVEFPVKNLRSATRKTFVTRQIQGPSRWNSTRAIFIMASINSKSSMVTAWYFLPFFKQNFDRPPLKIFHRRRNCCRRFRNRNKLWEKKETTEPDEKRIPFLPLANWRCYW